MSLIPFPKNQIVTDESIEIRIITSERKEFYKNIIKYLDEHIYFNYLKATDPNFGMNFQTQLPYYLRQDVGVNSALVIYYRRYPDHEDVDPLLLSIIQMELDNF